MHVRTADDSMTTAIFESEVQAVFDRVQAPGSAVFPSPENWRDACIYFLMVDRFNNPQVAPKNTPFDVQFSEF